MSTDVDDVVALCIANRMQDLGTVSLLGVVHDTGLPTGVGAISVINHHYGHDSIPIGAYKGSFDNPEASSGDPWVATSAAGPYVDELVRHCPAPVRNNSQVPSAVELYRSVLSEQPDGSVVIASFGFLGNLAALLASKPDSCSALTGRELVARKVRELVVMGGEYPPSRQLRYEWNFGGGCRWGSPRCEQTPVWTKAVVDGWPATVPLTFSGFELGVQVLTGRCVLSSLSERNPCRLALEMFGKVDPKCPPKASWDPVTTLYAARGLGSWGARHLGGHNRVNGTDGSNAWVEGPPTHHSYLTLVPGQQAALAAEIDELLCMEPHVLA